MSSLLMGNFEVQKQVDNKKATELTIEERFEQEALKRLSGSICFVSKQKVMWDVQDTLAQPAKAKVAT